jgi:hypothetical protein
MWDEAWVIVSIKSWRCGRHENSGIPGHRIEFNRHIKLSSSPPSPGLLSLAKNYIKVVLNSSNKLAHGLQIHVVHPVHR